MDSPSYTVVSTTTGTIPTSMAGTYSCVFRNLWTEARHPELFPTSSAHWSPTLIGSHNSNYQMWLPGELASVGVERVAEVRFFFHYPHATLFVLRTMDCSFVHSHFHCLGHRFSPPSWVACFCFCSLVSAYALIRSIHKLCKYIPNNRPDLQPC